MMYKKKVLLIFLAIMLFLSQTSFIYAKDNKTLIIYETKKNFSSIENKINHLNEILHNFSNKVKVVQIDEYKSSYMNNFDAVFVLNITQDIKNIKFLDDLSAYQNKIYWIGDKIEEFLNYSRKYEISYNFNNNNINKLLYKDKELLINPINSFNVLKASPKSIVLASMSDGYKMYPFIISEDNLYHISRWDLDVSFIFEDSLNDFFNITKFKNSEIFVNVKNVNPLSNTDDLKKIADYLHSENVPFIISLTPTYIDYMRYSLKTLDSKKDFINTIKYMQSKGGSIVLYGYTYKKRSENIIDDNYEFWDIHSNTPLNEDISLYIKNRILSGLRLCIENGIYPLGFEAPNYAMNDMGYNEIKKYFSTYIGRYQNNNESFNISTFPYVLKNTKNFNTFIPENLGTLDELNDFSLDIIKENFKKISMVRGCSGGFSFYPDLNISYLKQMITYLKDNKTLFMDLKQKDNYIKIDDIKITSKEGKIQSYYDKSKAISSGRKASKFEIAVKNINDIVIIFISSILVIFFIILLIFRRINTKKFTGR